MPDPESDGDQARCGAVLVRDQGDDLRGGAPARTDRNRASAGLIDASALSAMPAAARRTHAVSALQELVDELQPLAAARMQSFRLHAAPALQWEAPREAVETLLAN